MLSVDSTKVVMYCAQVIFRVQNPHTSRKTNKLVVCSDIVTGETVYLTLRYINIPILQNAILVSIMLYLNERDTQSYRILSYFPLLLVMEFRSLNQDLKKCHVMLQLPLFISEYGCWLMIIIVACTWIASSIYISFNEEYNLIHLITIVLSQISHDCFMIEFKKTEMQLWLKNLKNYCEINAVHWL